MKLEAHIYSSDSERRRDRIIGFVGWWVANLILFGVVSLFGSITSQYDPNQSVLQEQVITLIGFCLALLPWVVNIGGLIYFALTRSQIAVGALAAIAVLFALVVIAGVLFVVVCFVIVLTPRR